MKTKKLIITLALLPILTMALPASAVFCANCAQETTQILNKIQLAASYSKQAASYSTQLQQYQAQLTNMKLNPGSVLPKDIAALIKGLGEIMNSGQSMGMSMAEIEGNYATAYKNPTAAGYSENFKSNSVATRDTLQAAMKAAGMHLDSFPSSTSALQALYAKSQSSMGTVAALQTLSEINATQVIETQKLQSLIAESTIASSSYMASQNAKQQNVQDANEWVTKTKTMSPPTR
jgi:P-type conjugative transfer protein TrbJ